MLSDALAIGVGITLGRHLPEKALKIGAAAVFFGVGAYFAILGLPQLWAAIVNLYWLMLILSTL